MGRSKYRPNLAVNKLIEFSHYVETVEPWDESENYPEIETDVIVQSKKMRFRDALELCPDYLCYKHNYANGLGISTEPETDFRTGQSTTETVIFSGLSNSLENQLRAKYKH